MASLNVKAEAVLHMLVAEGAALLERHGKDKATAERSGQEFAFRVMQFFAGQYVWFPKMTARAIRQRNAAFLEEFEHSRESIQVLAAKHGLTSSIAYTVIAKTKDMTTGSKQNDSHPVIEGIALETARMLIKHDVLPSDAAEAARGFAAVIVARWAGRFVVFPKGTVIKARGRQEEIWKDFQAGASHDDLATRYGLSITQVYAIIRQRCIDNGMEPPSEKRKTNSFVSLRRRILEVAKPYESISPDRYALLKTAADIVVQAQKVKQ